MKRDNELLTFLEQEGIVAQIPARTGRLELIESWNASWRDGHGVLRRLFLHHRQEVIEWSKRHPEVALRYWEEGFRGLRSADRKEICPGQQILLQCRDCETVQELDDRIAALRKEIDETSQ